MKALILLVTFLMPLSYQTTTISEVREAYTYASDSKENIQKFHELVAQSEYQNDNVLMAYYGCALVLKASVGFNLIERLALFKKGKNIVDQTIAQDPSNIELRLIRLSIQVNVPRVLGYRKNIEEDKTFLLQHITSVTDTELRTLIEGFMASAEVFND